MKKALFSLVLVLCLLTLTLPAFAMVEQSESFYVADEADVLSPDAEETLIALNGELEYYCSGAQFVVVTTEYLDGMYADEYAAELFYAWGIGSAEENNGMLLLLAPGENKGWLSVGAGLTASFTDDLAGKYMDDYLWTDFDAGRYEEGVLSITKAIAEWYAEYYDVSFIYDGIHVGSSTPAEIPEPAPAVPGHVSGNTAVFTGIGGFVSSIFSLVFSIFRVIPVFFILIILIVILAADRSRYRAYYRWRGIPMPRYRFWYLFGGPHKGWHMPPHYGNDRHGVHYPGSRPPRPGMHHPGSFGGPRPGSSFHSRPGGSGFSSRPSSHRPGGFGGGGRPGGGSGFSRSGGSRTGGGGRSRGGAGRR